VKCRLDGPLRVSMSGYTEQLVEIEAIAVRR
jgi:hypothetical protein